MYADSKVKDTSPTFVKKVSSSSPQTTFKDLASGNMRPSKQINSKKKPTLLQLAKEYQSQNPEMILQREKEREQLIKESYGLLEEDPFWTKYYRDQEEEHAKKILRKEMKKYENPKLKIQLQFTRPRKLSTIESIFEDPYASSSTTFTYIEKTTSFLDNFKPEKAKPAESLNDLVVTVSKGKLLLNKMKQGKDKFDSSRLKFTLCTESGKNKQKQKTKDIYVSYKGKAWWNQAFVIRGFTAEQLAKSYAVLKVNGKWGEEKEMIGETILAGRKGTIGHRSSSVRGPTDEEAKYWHEAIENPGKKVEAVLDLLNLNEETFEGSTNTILRRGELDSLKSNGKFKAKSRNAVKKDARATVTTKKLDRVIT